ncbi:TP53-binding protein 1-like [Branchiostoma floridae]|uniref:TP53-binding protein 1-like n=1 Tax=Branchiostoma floridae TaxID=7739 RepID=A0A9J7MG49_BRAFL|nr:TP53-binding protein 1-like [Branchiostoma floridae]
MDLSQPDLSQRDDTPCFLVENSQQETQAEVDCSDGEDTIFRHKMLARLGALRDSSTSPIMEVEMMANGHKCHITMATGGPGQQGGGQHHGASGPQGAGPSGSQGGGAEDDGNGGAEQGGGGGGAGGGRGDGGDDDDNDNEEEGAGDDSHHEEEADTSTSTPQSSGNSSGSRSSLPGLVRPIPSIVTPVKVIPVHEIQESEEGDMSALSETEGRHEVDPGSSESEGLGGLSEASTALVTDSEMSPAYKSVPHLTSPGPSKLSGSSSSGSVQLQSSTISTISSFTSSSSGSSHTETPLKKSPRKTPIKSPRKDIKHLSEAQAAGIKVSPLKGKTKSPKKSPHKSPRKAGQGKESPMKARRRLGEEELSAAKNMEEKPSEEDTKQEGGTSGSSGASNKIHEHTSGELRMEVQYTGLEEQPLSIPDSQPTGRPDSPHLLSSQQDMFMEDVQRPQEEHVLSTPAENLGCLQLSGEPMLVQDTSLSSEGGSETVISPSPEAYGHTPHIIPSSPTGETEEQDKSLEVAEDPPVPSLQGSSHNSAQSQQELVDHPWQPSEPQWSQDLLAPGPDGEGPSGTKSADMTKDSTSRPPSLHLQLPDTELSSEHDESISQEVSNKGRPSVSTEQTKAEGLQDNKAASSSSSSGSSQTGRKSERQELKQTLDFLKGMFPSLDEDILISVYKAQNCLLEAAIEQLLEMSQGSGAIGVSVEMREDVQTQGKPESVTVRVQSVENPEDVLQTSGGDVAQKKKVSLWELASTSKDDPQTSYSQVEMIEEDADQEKEDVRKSEDDEKQVRTEDIAVQEGEGRSLQREDITDEQEEGSDDVQDNWALHFTPSLDGSQSQNVQSRVREMVEDLEDQSTEPELAPSQLLFLPQGQVTKQPVGPAPTEHSKEEVEDVHVGVTDTSSQKDEEAGNGPDVEEEADISVAEKEDSSVEVVLCDTEKEETPRESRATPSAQANNSESSVPFHLALPKDGGLFRPIATTPPLMKATRPRLPRHSTPVPDYTESPTDTTPTSAVTSADTTPEGNGSVFADPGTSGGQGLTTAANRGGQPGEGAPLQMRMGAVLESQSDHTQEDNQPPLFQLQKPPELDADQLKAIKESPSKLPSLFTRVREKVRAQQEEQDSSSEEDDAPGPADSEDLFDPPVSSRKKGQKVKGHRRRPVQLLDSEESEMSVQKTEGHIEGNEISQADVMDVEEEKVDVSLAQHTCGLYQETLARAEVKAEEQEEAPAEANDSCQSAGRERPMDRTSGETEEAIQPLKKSLSTSSNADTLEYWRSSEEGEQVPGHQVPDDESEKRGQRKDEASDGHAQVTKKRKRSPTTAETVAAPDTAGKDERPTLTGDPTTPEKLSAEEKDPYEYTSQVSPILDRRKRRHVVAAGLGSPPASIPTWRGPCTQTSSATRVVGVQANTQPSPTTTVKTKTKDKQRKSAKLRAHGGGTSPSGRGSTPSAQSTSREEGQPTGGDGGEEKEEEGGDGERIPGDGDGEEGQPPRKRVKIDEDNDTESAGGEEESPPQYVRETTITTITETIVKRVITEKIKRGQKIVDYQVIEEMEEPVVDIEEEVSISPSVSRTGSSLMSGELADISSLSTSASKSSPSSLSKSLSSSSLSRTNSSGPSLASLERTSSSQSKSSSSSPGTGGGDKDQEGFTKPVGSPRRRRSGIGSQLLGQQSKVTSGSQRLEVSETGTQTEAAGGKDAKDKGKGEGGSRPEGDEKGEKEQQSRRRKSSRTRQTETVSPEEPGRETDSPRRALRSGQATASASAVQKTSDSTEEETGRHSRTRTAGPSGKDSDKTAEEEIVEEGAAVQPSPKKTPRGRTPSGRTRGSPRRRGRRGGASAGSRSLSTEKLSKKPQGRKESRSSSAARSSRSSRGHESDEQSSDSSEERAGTPEIPFQGVQQRLSGRSEKPQEDTSRETVSSDSGSSEPREGARVMALLVSDKHWYPGVILKTLKNDRYLVRFEDEDETTVRPREIAARNMMVVSRLPVNTAVLASVEDVQDCVYAPGIIRGYHHNGETGEEEYLVEFNDGSTVRAPHANVILNPEQAAAYRAQVMRVAEVSASVSLDNLVTGKRKRPGAVKEQKTPDRGRATRDTEYSSGGTSSSITTPRGPQTKRRRVMEEAGEMDTGTGQTPKPSTSSPVRGVPTLPAGIMDSPQTQSARRSLRSQEDAVDIPHTEQLGPLPTNRRLFRGCAFILTAAPKDKAERASAAAESQSSEDSEEEVSTLPYSKSHVQRQIEQGGGKVYEDFKRMQERSKSTHLYLIADSFCRTKKYFLSLAHGIPCVSHQWIRDSCSQGRLQDYKAYLLPAGRSLETRNTIEWVPRGRIFQNMDVLVVSESRDFRDVWADILVAAGCVMAKKVSKEEAESAPLDCDLVVSDPSCPGALVQRAGQLGVRVVSTEWVIQCLIHSHRVGYTGHAKYRHDFKDS